MGTHVLVPIDGSRQSWNALDHALTRYSGERITVLHVVDPVEGIYGDSEDRYYDQEAHRRAIERGERLGEQARERANEIGEPLLTTIETAVEPGRPRRTIVSYAEDHGIDHIVMGTHGRSGISRILMGSVAESVARRAPVPVTIVRGPQSTLDNPDEADDE